MTQPKWMTYMQVFFSRRLDRGWADRHIALYRRTGGRVGGKTGALPVLLLTTTGRKTGQPRTTPLNYLTDGPNLVIAASNARLSKLPAWYFNLQTTPAATVEIGRKRIAVASREATPAERQRLWATLIAKAPNYAVYQETAPFTIPLLILQPGAGA